MKLTKRDWNKLKSKERVLTERKAVRVSRLPKRLETKLREHVNPDFQARTDISAGVTRSAGERVGSQKASLRPGAPHR